MSDIVFEGMIFDRLREIGDQSDRIASLESEIARLRLTDEERERTNHDAAPAARAAEPESSVPPRSVAAPANTHTLTDAEREAIAYFAVIEGDKYLPAANMAAATLRNLLERLK